MKFFLLLPFTYQAIVQLSQDTKFLGVSIAIHLLYSYICHLYAPLYYSGS